MAKKNEIDKIMDYVMTAEGTEYELTRTLRRRLRKLVREAYHVKPDHPSSVRETFCRFDFKRKFGFKP